MGSSGNSPQGMVSGTPFYLHSFNPTINCYCSDSRPLEAVGEEARAKYLLPMCVLPLPCLSEVWSASCGPWEFWRSVFLCRAAPERTEMFLPSHSLRPSGDAAPSIAPCAQQCSREHSCSVPWLSSCDGWEPQPKVALALLTERTVC